MPNQTGTFFLRDIVTKLLSEKLSAVALVIVVVYLVTALGFEVYSYYCKHTNTLPLYNIGNMEERFQEPSASHLLGTDYAGRDVFIRAAAGVKTAVKVGLIASLISATIGVALGALAGYFGGRIDDVVVWVYSTFASMPTLLFILAFALLVKKGFLLPRASLFFEKVSAMLNTDSGMMAIYLGIGITGWVALCRVVRAETMKIREMPYILSARSLGYGPFRIIARHILPNIFHLVIIYFTIRFAYAIMTEVIVSYLGLGVQLDPSWGTMIADGQERLWRGVWWEVAAATIFMFFLVLPLNFLGDRLRNILDPRLES